MKITINWIELQNFKSYGNVPTRINFNAGGLYLVLGKNLDDTTEGEHGGNGAGKTTISDALSYCWFNRTIDKVDLDDAINNINLKDMKVISNFTVDNNLYEITRGRKTPGGDALRIEENGKDITPDSVRTTNALIEKIVGMPYEIFIRILTFNAGIDSFLSLSSADQIEQIEHLFGITILTEKAEQLKETHKAIKLKIENETLALEQNKIQIAEHAKKLATTQVEYDRWVRENDGKLQIITAQLVPYGSIDYVTAERLLKEYDTLNLETTKVSLLEKDISDLEAVKIQIRDSILTTNKDNDDWILQQTKLIADIEIKIKAYDGIDFDVETSKLTEIISLTTTINNLTIDLNTKNADINRVDAEVIALQAELTHLGDNTCPYCKQLFVNTADKIKEISNKIAQKVTDKGTLEADKVTIQSSINDNKNIKLEIEGDAKYASFPMLNTAKNNLVALKSQLESIGKQINPYTAKLQKIKDDKLDEDLIAIDESIASLLAEKGEIDHTKITKAVADKKSELIFKDWVSYHASFTEYSVLQEKVRSIETATNPYEKLLEDIKKASIEVYDYTQLNTLKVASDHCTLTLKLLTKKDSYLRKDIMDRYLPFLNDRLTHYLSKLKLPHIVEFQSDFSIKIIRYGRQLPFSGMSRGQKSRINIALALAFKDIRQTMYGHINLSIYDEVLDTGMDTSGFLDAIALFKELANENPNQTIYLISHKGREINCHFKNIIWIEFKNGFSKFIPCDRC